MPVDPKGLMIDNWVNHKKHGNIQVLSIELPIAFGPKIINGYNLEDFNPIPLSSDILEASGFKLGFQEGGGDEDSNCWHKEGFRIWDSGDGTGFYHINSELIIHLDFIHELQNFYYLANSKEELNIIFK